MNQVVNPDKFVVPYAIDADVNIYHVKAGRPETKEISCPICRGKVSFISETDARAAHFRHHDRSDCDKQAHLLRGTIHNDIRDATVALLNGRYVASDICKGHAGIRLPKGFAEAEKEVTIDGKTYRPDVTVNPADGQIAATLELEVVWSHKPTPQRLQSAASVGRVVGILNAAQIERTYYQKRYANEAFDIPEAIKAFILEQRFTIMTDRHLKRAVNGILDREYCKATVRKEHRIAPQGPTYTAPPAPQPNTAPKPYSAPQPAQKPRQVMPHGDPHDRANAVLADLRKRSTEAEIKATLARYEDCIEDLKTSAPVRAIHIENLAAYKRKPLTQAW